MEVDEVVESQDLLALPVATQQNVSDKVIDISPLAIIAFIHACAQPRSCLLVGRQARKRAHSRLLLNRSRKTAQFIAPNMHHTLV